MKIRKALKSDSAKDFSSLFFSNILQKVFGLIREIIVASLFGSALIYANYLLLRTVADLFSQFTVGNALKANLLPKFTKILEKYNEVSLTKLFDFSKKTMVLIFVLSQIIQTFIIWYLDTDYTLELILISVLLSLSISFNFLNTIYLTFIQAQGKFLKYSLATTLNSFLVVVFIKPSTILFEAVSLGWGIIGLALSRLFGILTLTFSYILPMNKQQEGFEVELSRKDFNLPTLILGNFANIIILSSRFISGSDGGNGIAYFTYSVFILNAFLTSIVGNISTLLLRKMSIKNNNIFMYYSLVISVVIGGFLVVFFYFFSSDIIDFIYRRVISFFSDHNKFTTLDVRNTSRYLYELSYSFIFIFIATTLFQPFFSLSIEKSKKVRRNISIVFVLVILISFLYSYFIDLEIYKATLIVMYSSSIMSVLLAGYSYYYYYYLKNYVQKE